MHAEPIALPSSTSRVHFGGLVAIADMSFAVERGRAASSLIGPNGAGKTTAFNVVTGFLRPTQGEVRYRGVSLNGLKPHEVANLGLVRTFQKTSVFQNNTVFENVLIGLHRHGRATVWRRCSRCRACAGRGSELREEAWEILDFVGLERRAGELGGALPYGEQRLLEVAVALAAQPSMLLLDEPVSGMNASETASFIELLEQHPRARHHRPAGRARHAAGDGRVRPHRRAELRQDHRRRPAGGDPEQPRSHPRLSRDRACKHA